MFNSGDQGQYIYQNNSYTNLNEDNMAINSVYVYSESGTLIEKTGYYNGSLESKVTFYESGNRKMTLSCKHLGIVDFIRYFYDTDVEKYWIYVSYSNGIFSHFTVYYVSGYVQLYYEDGYLYEYNDEVTKSIGDSGYLSRTEYTIEAAQAKLDELLGE